MNDEDPKDVAKTLSIQLPIYLGIIVIGGFVFAGFICLLDQIF